MNEYKTTVYNSKGCVVRIHKPILVEEELNKRKEALKKALCRFETERRRRLCS